MRPTCLLLAALAIPWTSARAEPPSVRVGEVRVVAEPGGASLREQPSEEASASGRAETGTSVLVHEVHAPWIRVAVVAAPGEPAREGWLLLRETARPASSPGSSVRAADVSVSSGRGPETLRRLHPELAAALLRVDEMERATAALDRARAVAFIRSGRVGRPEQDDELPARLPPSPDAEPARPPASDGLTGLLGDLGERSGAEEGRRIGETAGRISRAIAEYSREMRRAFTPEQEYFLGRAVAAEAIAKYGVEPRADLRGYVRSVGDVLVRKSARVPPNFGGYHVEVLDSDEVRTVSAPGGFLLVTRGAVGACRDEDELAGLLAHGLAHVTGKHAERAIRASQAYRAQLTIFAEAVASASDVDDARFRKALLELFETTRVQAALESVEQRRAREHDVQADREGTFILIDVVYDHGALRDVLRRLPAEGPGEPGRRAEVLDALIREVGPAHASVVEARTQRAVRFRRALGR